MPTYQYQCKKCGNELEELQSMTEPPLVQCPKCKTDSLIRVMGGAGGFIFKGSGFYQTDYKKDSKKQSKKEEKPADKKEEKKGREEKEEKKEGKKDKKPERPSSASSASEEKD